MGKGKVRLCTVTHVHLTGDGQQKVHTRPVKKPSTQVICVESELAPTTKQTRELAVGPQDSIQKKHSIQVKPWRLFKDLHIS